MTTTIPFSGLKTKRHNREGGYTLVELMFSAGLSAIIFVAVMSTFLQLNRSGATLSNYNDMEAQSRRALEIFAEDVRQASTITWDTSTNTAFSITVNGASIIYAFNSGTGAFTRIDSSGTRNLITGVVASKFSFRAFNVTGTEISLASQTDRANANITTKQIQISLEASRSRSTLATATNKVLSARFILRNKPVTA